MTQTFEFSKLLLSLKNWQGLIEKLTVNHNKVGITVIEPARPYLTSALVNAINRPAIVITASMEKAEWFLEQIKPWLQPDISPLLFPAFDSLNPVEQKQETIVLSQRYLVLGELIEYNTKRQGRLPLIVSSIAAISQPVPSVDTINRGSINLTVNGKYEIKSLLHQLQQAGYENEQTVELPATFAHRGGIVDIYSPKYSLPVRAEFLGNTVDSLRLFNPETQRSVESMDSYCVLPVNIERNETSVSFLIDYLSDSTLIIDEPSEVYGVDTNGDEEAREEDILSREVDEEDRKKALILKRIELLPGQIHMERRLDRENNIYLPFKPAQSYKGSFNSLIVTLKKSAAGRGTYLIITSFVDRIREILAEENIFTNPGPDSGIDTSYPAAGIYIFNGSLNAGWSLTLEPENINIPASLNVLSDCEIFGFSRQKRFTRKRPARHFQYFLDLSPGDYVVHVEHGIARFKGTTHLTTDGVEKEYLLLEYASEDKLYVPVEHTDRVSKYIGGGAEPKLSRLRSTEWHRTKQRVRQSTLNIAKELLEISAYRQIMPGHAYQHDTLWQKELETSFPYIETLDQQETIRAVKEDMEKPHPMDRLVCGDVGYGKTEVAVRAAFKAVMDGKQVAVLVPTTILAEQHFNTFKQRLAAFPVHIESLSRFKSDDEQRDIIDRLALGSIDICIGTHRLLQKDVNFKELGLVIVDEEQKFGVGHKEKLKQLRREVDVLTLSATPIPRTLHMSLVGVRDISVMETPPEDRLPVKTTVSRYQNDLIREAVLKELKRSGQTYFVHNRVQDIYRVRERLQELLPEARIAVAHGQMPEEELENIMVDFISRKADILLCTTIIESGLDIPNVNTLIVDRAERLGLAQLYQLRGRVGRGTNQAYAYFLHSGDGRMTPAAERRLQTIFEASELGAGFFIAMRDLEIRGAGNILGSEQSGYINAVGFELFSQMLEEAVAGLKGETTAPAFRKKLPAVSLPLAAYIPEDYINNMVMRISCYKKIASATDIKALDDLRQELSDRFGPVPKNVEELFYVMKARLTCQEAGVRSILMEGGSVVIRLGTEQHLSPDLVQDLKNRGMKIGHHQVKLPGDITAEKLKSAIDYILNRLRGI